MRTRPLTLLAPALLCLAALLYSGWVLEVFYNFGPQKANHYVSELAAVDQPLSALLRSADITAAVLIGIALVLILRDVRPRRRLQYAAWGGVALFAIGTALDVAWPLSCAPHTDAACAAAEDAWTVPLTHQLHSLSSGLAGGAALLSLAAFVWLDAKEQRGTRWRRAGVSLLAVMAVTTVWTLAAVVLDELGYAAGVGVAQRLELLSIAAWLVYVAVRARVSSPAYVP